MPVVRPHKAGEAARSSRAEPSAVTYERCSEDPLFYAVVDKATGKVAGRQALMRIHALNGSVETGHIYWGQFRPFDCPTAGRN